MSDISQKEEDRRTALSAEALFRALLNGEASDQTAGSATDAPSQSSSATLQLLMDIIRALFDPKNQHALGNVGLAECLPDQVFDQAVQNLPQRAPLGMDFIGVSGLPESAATRPHPAERTVRTALSQGIEAYAKDSIRRGVDYQMGAKGGRSIDCSGFVQQAVGQAFGNISQRDLAKLFNTHSDGQVMAVAQRSGFMLRGAQVNNQNLDAGMIIGIDSGRKGFDTGRANGIDHVVAVYRDSQTNQLMVAQSSSGKGANALPLDQWLESANRTQWSLYAVDLVKLAREDQTMRAAAPSVLVADVAPATAAPGTKLVPPAA